MAEAVIEMKGLRKNYGDKCAVDGIDLTVRSGEIFAFLGPNGAGKTTTVEILEGYRKRDGGVVTVLGTDPAHGGVAWRSRVGIVLQECELQGLLTVREALKLYAGYYSNPRDVNATIELVGLADSADKRTSKLSGGQQRRLDVALALIGDPELLFLDEPTTGFDPAARRAAWELIASLRSLGKTIFLTTHYLDEAQHLADRLAVILDGRIVAQGTSSELLARNAETSVQFEASTGMIDRLPSDLRARATQRNDKVEILTDDPIRTLHELCGWALQENVSLERLEARRASLEDVYLELTRQ